MKAEVHFSDSFFNRLHDYLVEINPDADVEAFIKDNKQRIVDHVADCYQDQIHDEIGYIADGVAFMLDES